MVRVTIKQREKLIRNTKFSIEMYSSRLKELIKEQRAAIKRGRTKVKIKVKCDGTKNASWHQCEKRKCPHRLLHIPIKGECDKEVESWEGPSWCVGPNPSSLQHIRKDGGFVTCVPVGK